MPTCPMQILDTYMAYQTSLNHPHIPYNLKDILDTASSIPDIHIKAMLKQRACHVEACHQRACRA